MARVWGSIIGSNENLDGVRVKRGSKREFVSALNVFASEVYYCGEYKYECLCGTCGDRCGPSKGCPCLACLALLKRKRAERGYSEPNKNLDGVTMFLGDGNTRGLGDLGPSETYYCGRRRPSGPCFCGMCVSGRCGPNTGCPCVPCAITQLRMTSRKKNTENDPVWRGFGLGRAGFTTLQPSQVYYCGKERGRCPCGTCATICGPNSGCPCPACNQLINEPPQTFTNNHINYRSNNRLAELAVSGEWDELKRMVWQGAVGDVNGRAGEKQWSALCCAAALGLVDVVQLLLAQQGIRVNDPNEDGVRPIHEAVRFQKCNVVKILLDAGADPSLRTKYGHTAFDFAIDGSPAHITLSQHVMLSHAMHISGNIKANMQEAITRNDKHTLVNMIHSNQIDINCILPNGLTPLCFAIERKNCEIANMLVSGGANVDKPSRCGRRPLFIAAMNGFVEIVRLLLEKKAHCDAVNESQNKWTALHVAAFYDKVDVATELIRAGANPLLRSTTSQRPVDVAQSPLLKTLLTWHVQKVEFDTAIRTIIASGATTLEELNELATKVTSVYDLSPLCSVVTTLISGGISTLTRESFKPVLTKVLDRILQEKLVLDDEALLFFKKMVKHCYVCGILNQTEYKRWKLRAVKANIQNIDQLLQIMRQVQENSWRLHILEQRMNQADSNFNRMVDAYRHLQVGMNNLNRRVDQVQEVMFHNQEREEKIRKMRRVLGFVSMALSIVGGPIVREIGEYVIDLANPIELLNFAVEESDIELFFDKDWPDIDLKPAVENVLEEISLPKKKFIEELKSSIQFGNFDLLNQNFPPEVRRPSLSANEWIHQPRESEYATRNTTMGRQPRLADVVKQLMKLRSIESDDFKMDDSQPSPQQTSRSDSPMSQAKDVGDFATGDYSWVEDIEQFPYHQAIEYSKGDLAEYLWLVENLDSEIDDINTRLAAILPNDEVEAWTPLQYATHMGYVEIVAHLLKDPSVQRDGKQTAILVRAKTRRNVMSQAA